MIYFICMLLPSAIICSAKDRYYKHYTSTTNIIFEYCTYAFFSNFLSIGVLSFLLGYNISVMNSILMRNDFAFKYAALVLCFNAFIAFAEYVFSRKKISVTINIPEKKYNIEYVKRAVLCGMTIALISMLLVRVCDNYFWGDEAFSIRLAQRSIPDLIQYTANDVHPPLYYIVLRVFGMVFGNYGYVYHLASAIPAIIVLFIGVTAILKRFGRCASIVFCTSSVILPAAVLYSLEVRMYSLCAMFTLISFLTLYDVLRTHKWSAYIIFMIASLGAAYTHYYALITVAFLYLVLIAVAIYRKEYKKTAWICCITVIAYLPWLTVLWGAFNKTSDSWWLDSMPSFEECVVFLFGQRMTAYLMLFLLVYYFLGKLKIFYVACSQHDRHEVRFGTLNMDDFLQEKSLERLWILAGVFSCIGTVAVGFGLSYLIRPLFVTRYTYQLVPILCLIAAVCISSFKQKHLISILSVVYLFCTFFPSYMATYEEEATWNEALNEILDTIEITSEDMILSDESHFNWTVGEYYFPENERNAVSSVENTVGYIEAIDEGDVYLFISGASSESFIEELKDEIDNEITLLYNDAWIGYRWLDIYVVECK